MLSREYIEQQLIENGTNPFLIYEQNIQTLWDFESAINNFNNIIIIAHGNENGITFSDDFTLNEETLQDINGRICWWNDVSIRLVSCNTWAWENSIWEQISLYLNVDVSAPNGFVSSSNPDIVWNKLNVRYRSLEINTLFWIEIWNPWEYVNFTY